MNKTNTTTTLNDIKSLCAKRDRREQSILESNRLERAKREEAERERIQNSNSILNSYIEKAKARENQNSQERSQMVQNLHNESMRRRSEDAYRSREISSAISRGIRNAREDESRKTADVFMDRNKRLIEKGIDAVKKQRSKTYFS